MINDEFLLAVLVIGLGGMALTNFYSSLSSFEAFVFLVSLVGLVSAALFVLWQMFSKTARERRKKIETIRELPESLLRKSEDSLKLGEECDLEIPVFLPDFIRSRHVHILGATGSGKTESVILNFIGQDYDRKFGSIILDAKGDNSFLHYLEQKIPKEDLLVFDLGSEVTEPYDPLAAGSPLEAAQRLFSSLTWSEEYYKSKALSALQRIFQFYHEKHERNPTLMNVSGYLESPANYTSTTPPDYPKNLAERDFLELSGLRDQIKSLCTGYLAKTLSPVQGSGIQLSEASNKKVIYFRLQSLLSPQLVGIVGKLIINHLNFLAGSIHRNSKQAQPTKMVPVYLDEFASFACPEFADLISKARSAGFALHFSHQSVGDLVEVSKGFLNRITDNSATKIVMRINDPDSADFFARTFGTKIYQKITQRVTNAEETDLAEVLSEGTQREAHQFRAAPDLFKTLPTGSGSVLIAHGIETPHGASSVLKIKFPKLEEDKDEKENRSSRSFA